MPRRTGRPRANIKQKILKQWAEDEKSLEAILPKPLGSPAWRMAYEAACLRLTLEKASKLEIARCAPLIEKLRKTKWALANDPRKALPDCEFLERLIEARAPGFDWRRDAQQGEIEERNRKQEDERIAQEQAEDAQSKMALTTKFHTPNAPDLWRLWSLAWEWRHKKRVIRRTWPTLRELKLATAIPERTLKKIIKRLRPRNREIIKEPIRNKFSTRGAVPLRYGPRLIISVLNEFINRLAEFPIEDHERKQLRKTALLVKRAFAARLSCSHRTT